MQKVKKAAAQLDSRAAVYVLNNLKNNQIVIENYEIFCELYEKAINCKDCGIVPLFSDGSLIVKQKINDDCIDLAKPTENMQGISVIKSTPRITKPELNEYIENLKEHYDVKYYEDVYDWTHSYVQEDKMITMPSEKGNERLMRAVFVDNNKSFPIKDSKGKVRGKLGAVSYREKGTTDKNELDDYYEAISDLVLYKKEQTEDEEESYED